MRLPPHRINLANYERRSRDACYYLEPALRLAAHRAFMASDNFFLPAGVRPPFFLAGAGLVRALAPALRRAQFALAAAESLARVAADMPRLPLAPAGEGEGGLLPPKSEANRRSSV